MMVFGILTYFGCYYFNGRNNNLKAVILKSLTPAILYGIVIELLQTFIPQRGFDYADVTADIIGAIIGVILFRYLIYDKFQDN